MIADLKPYPVYKNSGVPWLGRIPAHWEILCGKALFSESRLEVRDLDEIVTCFRDGQVTLRRNRRASGFMIALKEAGYQGVRKGQLVIHAMDAFAGAVGVSESDGKCTPEYIVCNPRRPDVAPGYFTHVLRLAAQSKFIEVACPAVRERAPRLRYPDFGALQLPFPASAEQDFILRYLDHSNRSIQRYIRAKKNLIALLNEQKQAIIHRAVTRGLGPNVRLKPSGVEWLGDVPVHWEVMALRLRYSQCLGKMLDSKRILGLHLLPYLRNTDVQWDRINTTELPVMDIAPVEYERYTVKIGDLLICEGGEVGRCAVWDGPIEVCGFQKALHRLRPLSQDCDVPRFLLYVLRVAVKTGAFADGHESTIAHLTGDKLRAHRFAFPSRAEQEAIVTHIEGATSSIDQAVVASQREIDFVLEYRTRLIADVVTGKLDVREASARLPAEARDPEQIEEPEAPMKGDNDPEGDLDTGWEEADA